MVVEVVGMVLELEDSFLRRSSRCFWRSASMRERAGAERLW